MDVVEVDLLWTGWPSLWQLQPKKWYNYWQQIKFIFERGLSYGIL